MSQIILTHGEYRLYIKDFVVLITVGRRCQQNQQNQMTTTLEQKILKLIADEKKYNDYLSKRCDDYKINEVVVVPNKSFLSGALRSISIEDLSKILNTQFIGQIEKNSNNCNKRPIWDFPRHPFDIRKNSYIIRSIQNEEMSTYGMRFTSELSIKTHLVEDLGIHCDNGTSQNLTLGDIDVKMDLNAYNKLRRRNPSTFIGERRFNEKHRNKISRKPPLKMIYNQTSNLENSNIQELKSRRRILFHVHNHNGLRNNEMSNISLPTIEQRNPDDDNFENDDIQNQITIRPPIPLSNADGEHLTKEHEIVSYTDSENDTESENILQINQPVSSVACTSDNKLKNILTKKMIVLVVDKTENMTDSSKKYSPRIHHLMNTRKWKECFIQVYSDSSTKKMILSFSDKRGKEFSNNYDNKKKWYFHQIYNFFINVNHEIKSLSIINDTICIERVIPRNSRGRLVTKIILYFIKGSSRIQLQDLYNFLCVNIEPNYKTVSHTISLGNNGCSLVLKFNSVVSDCLRYLTQLRNRMSMIQICENGYSECNSPLRMFINVLLLETTKTDKQPFNPAFYQEGLFIKCNKFEKNISHFFNLNPFKFDLAELKECSTYFLKPSKRSLISDTSYSSSSEGNFVKTPACTEGYVFISFETKFNDVIDPLRCFYKEKYLVVIGSLLFFVVPQRARVLFLSKPQPNLKKEVNYKNQNKTENIDIIYLDNNNHLPWLNNKCTVSDFIRSDYLYFTEFQRKISLILCSSYCIDLKTITSIELVKPNVTNDNEKYYTKLTKKLTYCNNTDQQNSNVVPSFIYLVTTDNSVISILLPSEQLANYWMIALRHIVKLNKVKATHISEDNTSKKDAVTTNTRVNNHFNSIDVANPYKGDECEYNDASDMTQIKSTFSMLLNRGILYQKTGLYHQYGKYFVLLIPGTIIMYKLEYRDIKWQKRQNIVYKFYRTIPLDSCYIYRGNSPYKDVLPEIQSNNSNKNKKQSIYKLYNGGMRNGEERYMRSFTIQYGRTNKTQFEHENNETAAYVNNVGEQLDGIAHNQKLSRGVMAVYRLYQSMADKGRYYFLNRQIFLASSQEECDTWYTLISGEIDRLQR